MASIVVDGERSEYVLRITQGLPAVDHDWVSGPNPGVGFSAGADGAHLPSVHMATAAIRTLLAQVDRATGFIDREGREGV